MNLSRKISALSNLSLREARMLPATDPGTRLATYAGTVVRWIDTLSSLRKRGALDTSRGLYPEVFLLSLEIEKFKLFERKNGPVAAAHLETVYAATIRQTFHPYLAIMAHWFPGRFQVILAQKTGSECRILVHILQKRLSRAMRNRPEVHTNIALIPVPFEGFRLRSSFFLRALLISSVHLSREGHLGPDRYIECDERFSRPIFMMRPNPAAENAVK